MGAPDPPVQGAAGTQTHNRLRASAQDTPALSPLTNDSWGMIMRDDLLHAKASVDWAVANFPDFHHRMSAWMNVNFKAVWEDYEPDPEYYRLVVVQESPAPLEFQVEFGIFVNAIRSGLDILATSLAYRYNMLRPDDAYFPMARSQVEFESMKGYKGHHFIQGLPSREREVFFELIKPYRGGHAFLSFLHDLDIMRKHKKLLEFGAIPSRFGLNGQAAQGIKIGPRRFTRVDNKTELCVLSKSTPHAYGKVVLLIAFDETLAPKGTSVASTFEDFAVTAKTIISYFDTP